MPVAKKHHWIVVVEPDRPDIYAKLRRSFEGSPLVEVLVDRRRIERRRRTSGVSVERRRMERRTPPVRRGDSPIDGYRLIQEANGFLVLQAASRVPTQCAECGVPLEFEMPRFAELPARLEVHVVHQSRAQHVVEAQAFRGSGRPFLACRMLARRRIVAPTADLA